MDIQFIKTHTLILYMIFALKYRSVCLYFRLSRSGIFNRAVFGYKLSFILLIAAVVLSLYVSVRLYPEIKRVKQEIASFESTSPDEPLRKKFRSLHAQSAILNILMLADGAALLSISYRLKT